MPTKLDKCFRQDIAKELNELFRVRDKLKGFREYREQVDAQNLEKLYRNISNCGMDYKERSHIISVMKEKKQLSKRFVKRINTISRKMLELENFLLLYQGKKFELDYLWNVTFNQ